ncbi:MAG: thioredoxin family protein [Phycisphaeraceae bacterium]
MARTESTMLDLSTPAPDFALPNLEGETVSLSDFKGKAGLVVMFICNHCPFVKHIENQLAEVAKDYQARNVGFVGICSNDQDEYADDRPEGLEDQKQRAGFSFPYLVDADQSVARAYKAACTPDIYVFDGDLKLFYRGQLDDSRPGNDNPVDGKDLRAALETLLGDQKPPPEQRPSVGCNIKWKKGNEPDYFAA